MHWPVSLIFRVQFLFTTLKTLIFSFILWWSWIAFNCGCSYGITGGKWHYAARAGVGTAVATWGAGTFGIAYSSFLHKGKIDVFEVISGIICAMGKTYIRNLLSVKISLTMQLA